MKCQEQLKTDRKNWLFSASVIGVRVSANLYSLIETAKAISNLLEIRNQWDCKTIAKRVWSDAENSPIPVNIYELLREQYYCQMEDLYSLTGIPEVKQWLSEADSDITPANIMS